MANGNTYNPLGLSAEGKEGSGLAQVFTPYDAGKYEIAKGEEAKNKAAADAKNKAEAKKNIKFDMPDRIDVWSPYYDAAAKQYKVIEDKYISIYEALSDNPESVELQVALAKTAHEHKIYSNELVKIGEAQNNYDAFRAILDKPDPNGFIDKEKSAENLTNMYSYNKDNDIWTEFDVDVNYDPIEYNLAAFNQTKWSDDQMANILKKSEVVGSSYETKDGDLYRTVGSEKQIIKAEDVKETYIGSYLGSRGANAPYPALDRQVEAYLKDNGDLPDNWGSMTLLEQAKYSSDFGYITDLMTPAGYSKTSLALQESGSGGSGSKADLNPEYIDPDKSSTTLTLKAKVIPPSLLTWMDNNLNTDFANRIPATNISEISPQNLPSVYLAGGKSVSTGALTQDHIILSADGIDEGVSDLKNMKSTGDAKVGVYIIDKTTGLPVDTDEFNKLSYAERQSGYEPVLMVNENWTVGQGASLGTLIPLDKVARINKENRTLIREKYQDILDNVNNDFFKDPNQSTNANEVDEYEKFVIE